MASGVAPTLDELADRLSAWLAGDYHARGRTGNAMDGRTPAEVFDACLPVRRDLADEIRAVTLWRPSRPTAYGRAGVLCNDIRYGATAAELYNRIGRTTAYWDKAA